MSDMLAQGAAWLSDQRHQHLTKTVTYRRGGSVISLQATVGSTVFEAQSGEGEVGLDTISRDFLVRAADLVLPPSTEPTLPQVGDRIEETDALGRVHVHEVLQLGSSPGWKYSDTSRLCLRIHTKEVDLL